jgi:hypothetical protein
VCDVTTGILVASTLFGAHQANQQGKYQGDLADYNSQVSQNNAITQQRLAKDALERGERDELQHRLRVAKQKGDQRAAFAANGVDVGSGSPLVVAEDTDALGELDALTIRNNAEREAYGYEVNANNYTNQSELDSVQGDLYRSAGQSNAFGTLLSGGGRVSESWYKNNGTTKKKTK